MGTIEELGTLCMHSCMIGKLPMCIGDMGAQNLKLTVTLNELSNPY